ncbi:MAG: helix-turn-helix domain-containing protein [Betaproteobacteria bacterium]
MKTPPKNRFGRALRTARAARKISQEGFGEVSGRTYISQLERGERQATLTKIDGLATVLALHPGALVLLSYLPERPALDTLDRLLAQIRRDVQQVLAPTLES